MHVRDGAQHDVREAEHGRDQLALGRGQGLVDEGEVAAVDEPVAVEQQEAFHRLRACGLGRIASVAAREPGPVVIGRAAGAAARCPIAIAASGGRAVGRALGRVGRSGRVGPDRRARDPTGGRLRVTTHCGPAGRWWAVPMPRWRLAATLAILALAVRPAACCGRRPIPVVDGWPIGPELDCTTRDDCAHAAGLARERLDRRDSGPCRRLGGQPAPRGHAPRPSDRRAHPADPQRRIPVIAVFELGDGTMTAIGVGYPGISREPIVVRHRAVAEGRPRRRRPRGPMPRSRSSRGCSASLGTHETTTPCAHLLHIRARS